MGRAPRIPAVLCFWLAAGLLGCNGVFLFGQKVSSIQVTPANPTIQVGNTVQFSAIVTFRDATLEFASQAVIWRRVFASSLRRSPNKTRRSRQRTKSSAICS